MLLLGGDLNEIRELPSRQALIHYSLLSLGRLTSFLFLFHCHCQPRLSRTWVTEESSNGLLGGCCVFSQEVDLGYGSLEPSSFFLAQWFKHQGKGPMYSDSDLSWLWLQESNESFINFELWFPWPLMLLFYVFMRSFPFRWAQSWKTLQDVGLKLEFIQITEFQFIKYFLLMDVCTYLTYM